MESSRVRSSLAYGFAVLLLSIATQSQAVTINEDDLLLLDVVLGRQQLAPSITAYHSNGKTYVSLAEIGAALEFPIDVDIRNGKASGYFIDQSRSFLLDINTGTVTAGKAQHRFSDDDVTIHGNGVLVELTSLSRWFPVDLGLDKPGLSITVSPREALPVQARENRRRSAAQIAYTGPAILPRLENEYRLISAPVLDLGVGYSINRRRDDQSPTTSLNYSGLLAGDLAYMDSRVYFSGSKNEALSNFRASLSRDNLGLPLGLRYVEIGDIVPAQVPGISSSQIERGILIQGGGSATGRDDLIDGDTIRIAGDALTGWDVELFQNGMRIGFQTIGPDGRYNFQNIEPISGENNFELVFYGPGGEQRRETVTRYSGLTPDQPGSIRYQFSASEKGMQIYDPKEPKNSSSLSNRGTARVGAGFDIRVLPQLSLRAAWNSVVVNDKRLNYTSLGARAAVSGVTLGVDATRDPLGGTRWDASLQVPTSLSLWGFDTRFIHSHYANYIPEDESNELGLTSRTGVTISGPIGPVATRFSAFHNRAPDQKYNTYSAGFTSRFNNYHFGNTLSYDQFNVGSKELEDRNRLYGSAFFTTRTDVMTLRGGISYTLNPQSKVDEYFLDSNFRVANDMTMNFGLSYDPLTEITRYTSGINWQLPQIMLSPRLSYDSKGNYSGFIYASFSAGSRPDRAGVLLSNRSLANNGTLLARVFLDMDGDGTFSSGDKPISGVRIRAPQASRSAQTDDEGIARFTGLSSDRATDVILDTNTLPNLSMTLSRDGNSISPRATTAQVVDFPVVLTGSLEGRALTENAGRRTALAGALIELVNARGNVQMFKASAHDGFFSFEGVPYGDYTIRLGGVRGGSASPRKISIAERRPDIQGVDLIATDVASASSAQIGTLPPPFEALAQKEALQPRSESKSVQQNTQSSEAATERKDSDSNADMPDPTTRPRPGKDGKLIQLGAFSSVANAVTQIQGYIASGLLNANEVHILETSSSSKGALHRVIVSPGNTRADARCREIRMRGAQCLTIDPSVL